MKIEEIKAGKKYYHRITTQADDKMTGKRQKQINILFVVEVDIPGNRVCASQNGFPAQWFRQTKFSRWKEENPELVKKCTCKSGDVEKYVMCQNNCTKNLKANEA